MKGNFSNHTTVSGDRELGDRIRAYSLKSGKREYAIAEEMHWNPAVYKATVWGWLHGKNPGKSSVDRVREYLTRMGEG